MAAAITLRPPWFPAPGAAAHNNQLATGRWTARRQRNGNGGEGPALATNARRDDNKNSDVQGDPAPAPAPALGKEMSYGMDEMARAAADDT